MKRLLLATRANPGPPSGLSFQNAKPRSSYPEEELGDKNTSLMGLPSDLSIQEKDTVPRLSCRLEIEFKINWLCKAGNARLANRHTYLELTGSLTEG